MAGYTFTTASQIATGLAVLASTYTTEFTALQAAFNSATGHAHDGSSGNGPKISLTSAVTGTLPVANGGTGGTTASAARTALGLAIGTDVQAYDAELAAIAGLTSAADKGIQFTGSGTAATYDLTAAGKALLDDADASAQRTTLGLGTISTQAASNVSISGGTITGITDIAVADGGTGASTAAAARTNLSAAALSQTQEVLAGFITSPRDKTYKLVVKIPHAGTITETTTICVSGTCTATFKINTTNLGGTANSVSSSEQSQSHASANVFSAGDDIQVTISSNSSCADMSFSIKYTRVLE